MIRRVGLVYDHRPRPETTGLYCLRALESLVDVAHLHPEQLPHVAPHEFDLYLCVDEGLNYPWPEELKPAVYWAIDTHLDFTRERERSRAFDLVVAAQQNGSQALERELHRPVPWLPLACDPELHRVPMERKEYDWAFVGNLFPGPRQELVEQLQEEFPRRFVGRAYFLQMARIYARAKLVFNRSIRDDLNMRVFEALASGSLLITNELPDNGLEELFHAGTHLVTYHSPWDLLEQVHWYLEHERERELIARRGQQEVLEKHTYRHRMQTLLQLAEQQLSARTAQPAPLNLQGQVTAASPSVPVAVPQESAAMRENPQPQKTADYYQHERREVLMLVPETARRVLDVGCGSGRLGALIRQRQPAEVIGIEFNPQAAALAREHLDEVHELDLEGPLPDWEPGSFDAIIAADILEHLRQPQQLLKQLHRLLSEDGQLIVSLPNVRHHSVIRSLLDGNWTYEAAGLLDEDHLRFFTRREIEKLFFRSGLEIVRWQIVPGPGHADWTRAGRPQEARVGGLNYRGRNPQDTEELFAYQFLVVARPLPVPADGLTSIVLVTHNQWSYTRACLESIRRLTDEPYELIVVDNASTDETVPELRRMPEVRRIENDRNRGFPAAVNQGLAVSTGAQVLLLNNDTLVTTGWLRRLLSALQSDPRIGLVGPVSNNVSGPQQVPAGYDDLSGLDGFAWDWGRDYQGVVTDLDRLVGFCLLIRGEVIEAIGELDERFGIGNFEDDDYCRRARAAGYRTVVAQSAYIHHFGGQTFRHSGIDFRQLLEENERKYQEKWAEPAPEPTAESTENRPLLSLCMIVRDNESTIRPALESIRPYVDELVVVDTGSTDRTPQIVQELDARLSYFEWCDDFAAARNASLAQALGEWIFWMDSDDTIPPACGQRLRALVEQQHPDEVLGYVMQVHCPGPTGQSDVTVVDHVKLFRNRPDLRFEGRIHEQILGPIRRAGGTVEWSDIYVVHSGSDQSPQGRQRKRDRDLRILQREYEEQPDHPFVLFNLGMTYADGDQHAEAEHYLRRCLEVSQPQESHVRKAYALLVGSLNQQGEVEQAEASCDQGLALFAEDAELLFRRGTLYQAHRQWPEAEACYQKLVTLEPERCFSSRDQGLTGYKAQHNLAMLYADQQRWPEAETAWREALQSQPDSVAAWRGLGEAALARQDAHRIQSLLEELAIQPDLTAEVWLLQSRWQHQQGHTKAALNVLREGCRQTPECPELTEELTQRLSEQGELAEATQLLTELLLRFPERAAAWHNLGTLHAHQQQWNPAVKAYRQSLQHRPLAPQTALQLGQALLAAGEEHQARQVWEDTLILCPHHPGLTSALQHLSATVNA